MKISQYPAAPSATASDILVIVQNGVTLRATAGQLAALSGVAPVTSVNGLMGVVVLTAANIGSRSVAEVAADIAAHNIAAAAHGGVQVAFAEHLAVGGIAQHPVATTLRAGFLDTLPNIATQFMNGLGAWAVPAGVGRDPSTIRVAFAASPISVPPGELGTYLADTSGGVIVFNLPVIVADMDGDRVIVKICTLGANSASIVAGAGNNIDGAATLDLTVLYQSFTLVASFDAGGSYWSII